MLVSQWHKMTQSGVCSAAILLPRKGNGTIPATKGTKDAWTLWSCLAGWFCIFSWYNKTFEHAEHEPSGPDCSGKPTVFGTKLLLSRGTCHKRRPIPHICHRCRKWSLFQKTKSVCKWGGIQKTFHLWLRSFNWVSGILQLLKRRSHFFPLLFLWILMTLQATCSWSFLSVTIATDNSARHILPPAGQRQVPRDWNIC